jgi:mannose-6-phosphate isomerase
MLPLRLLPLFKERPWGVRDLAPWFPDQRPDTPIGEAWFTSAENRVEGGPTLGELALADARQLFGRESRDALCPLLLKLLFTSERLSVQVHPDDEYARAHHDSLGKTEAWHVLEARPDAAIGLGFTRRLDRAEAVRAARSGDIETLLDWRPTRPGDTWLVPAGTVHAIGAGLTIVEVQENSDITYRLFDYGRPRELHLDRGFEVADLAPYAVANQTRAIAPGRDLLTACAYFRLERWRVGGTLSYSAGEPFYHLVIVVGGEGTLLGTTLLPGQVWLVPAAARAFAGSFHGELLLAYTNDTPTRAFSAS